MLVHLFIFFEKLNLHFEVHLKLHVHWRLTCPPNDNIAVYIRGKTDSVATLLVETIRYISIAHFLGQGVEQEDAV